jgi:hypothetical protein
MKSAFYLKLFEIRAFHSVTLHRMPLLYHDMTISFDHAAVEQLPVVLSK